MECKLKENQHDRFYHLWIKIKYKLSEINNSFDHREAITLEPDVAHDLGTNDHQEIAKYVSNRARKIRAW